MSSQIHQRPRSFVRRLCAAVLTALAVTAASVALVASPAAAHDELLSTDPANGTTVATLPAQITLTFSASVLAGETGNEVQVTDASGASLTDGAPVIADNVVTQALTGSASGAVQVLWRVVSQDGHPVSGELAFTVTGASTPSTTASSTPAATITPKASASPAPTTPATTAPTASDDGTSPTVWIIGGAIAIAALAVIVYLLTKRSRQAKKLQSTIPPETEDGAER